MHPNANTSPGVKAETEEVTFDIQRFSRKQTMRAVYGPPNAVCAAGFISMLLIFHSCLSACGLNWSPPISYFDGVDFRGNVHIVRELGRLDLGTEAFRPPIYLIFNSNFGDSPYAGTGFEVPMLDAKFVQISENGFLMRSPSGWILQFNRSKIPNILEGSAGWKAEIQGRMITACAPCGTKVVFREGRIASLSSESKTLEYVYSGSKISKILENQRVVLEVTHREGSESVSGIRLNGGEQITFETASRPHFEVIHGLPVVGRMTNSICRVNWQDGRTESWDFAIDHKGNPTLSFQRRLFVWDARNRWVKRIDDWEFQIDPAENPLEESVVSRKNEDGEHERWMPNFPVGGSTVETKDGIKQVTQYYSSGLLSGKVRKIVRANAEGGSEVVYAASYNERGELLRESSESIERDFRYASDGKQILLASNQKARPFLFRLAEIDGVRIDESAFDPMPRIAGPHLTAVEKNGLLQSLGDESGTKAVLSSLWNAQ